MVVTMVTGIKSCKHNYYTFTMFAKCLVAIGLLLLWALIRNMLLDDCQEKLMMIIIIHEYYRLTHSIRTLKNKHTSLNK